MSRVKEIHEYLISIGKKEEDLLKLDTFSVYLSMEIMEYAHRNQKRENGEEYANHPSRCMQKYRDLVGIDPNNYSFDRDELYDYGIPYDGVQEVCLLHDVLEDTDFTIDDIEEIFDENDLGDYFRMYIKTPLLLITHDKEVDYKSYIYTCMENPIAAIAKMMDLQDNLNLLTLTTLNESNLDRAGKYVLYLFMLNAKYQFVERIQLYKKDLANENN